MNAIDMKDIIGLVAVTLIFGGGAVFLITATLAQNWRKARVAEQNAVLKQTMIERGFSPEEIVAVINAGATGRVKMAKLSPNPAPALAASA